MNEDNFFDTFIAESRSHISIMEKNLLDIESSADRKNLLQEIFRAAHTIKGSSSIIRYISIKDVAHAMESILQIMLDDISIFSNEIVDALLNACDFLSSALEKLPDTDYGMDEKDAVCEKLYALAPVLTKSVNLKSSYAPIQDISGEISIEQKNDSQIYFLLFESGNIFFATPLYCIKEVLRKIYIKPINILEEHILGIVNYHGEILPIIDFNRRFGLFKKLNCDEACIIVFKLREALLGVKVDALVKLFLPEQMTCVPETNDTLRLYCDGYYEIDGREIHIINIDTLFYRERS